MTDEKRDYMVTPDNRQMAMALSRWDGEGGAGPSGPQEGSGSVDFSSTNLPLTDVELVQLRIRVIALENLVISFLASASDGQLELVREMATYISPRPGFTPHPLTIHAANQMNHLVERAARFRGSDADIGAPTAIPPAPEPYKRTSVFDHNTLPLGLRREHRTKPGVWGVIRVLDGRVRYQILDPASDVILEPGKPGLITPDQPHCVEPLGPMRMQVEFYNQLPNLKIDVSDPASKKAVSSDHSLRK